MHLWLLVLLSKCIANAVSKYRIYTASLQRARVGPTTLPQRLHSALSNTLYKRQAVALSLFKMISAA